MINQICSLTFLTIKLYMQFVFSLAMHGIDLNLFVDCFVSNGNEGFCTSQLVQYLKIFESLS